MDLRGETAQHAMPALTWRPMGPDDLDAVTGIAAIGFPDHFEGRACFANRLGLYPSGCFVLTGEDDEPKGYLVAYPWRAQSAPPLNTLIEAIPVDVEVLYLHDLALHPDARGQGASRFIVERLARDATADGWPALALVAVNAAAPFWEGQGFSVVETPGMAAKLASYGPDARYMVRRL